MEQHSCGLSCPTSWGPVLHTRKPKHSCASIKQARVPVSPDRTLASRSENLAKKTLEPHHVTRSFSMHDVRQQGPGFAGDTGTARARQSLKKWPSRCPVLLPHERNTQSRQEIPRHFVRRVLQENSKCPTDIHETQIFLCGNGRHCKESCNFNDTGAQAKPDSTTEAPRERT